MNGFTAHHLVNRLVYYEIIVKFYKIDPRVRKDDNQK